MSRRPSYPVALCGVLGALSVALMLVGVILPLALYIAPIAAGLLVLVAREECGGRMAWAMYCAVALLAVLFVPDKEVAFTFVFLSGPYPLCKEKLDAVRTGPLRMALKLFFFNLMLVLMYGLLLVLFFPGMLRFPMPAEEIAFLTLLWAIGNLAFVLFDRALVNLLRVYRLVWQKKLRRMLRYKS